MIVQSYYVPVKILDNFSGSQKVVRIFFLLKLMGISFSIYEISPYE